MISQVRSNLWRFPFIDAITGIAHHPSFGLPTSDFNFWVIAELGLVFTIPLSIVSRIFTESCASSNHVESAAHRRW